MEINKAALAKGDRNEFLKLARSIRPSTTLNKAEHPLAAQFFGDNSTEVRHLDTRQLIESLAGQPYNEKLKWIEAVAAAGYAGIALDRPSKMADVTRIGGGAGWTAPKPAVASAKA
ncbi:MAG: hypothetical protein JWQ87_5510, partial [Candidatus Sulfotelmatobacter sp.]|nr:hypothetical protein [Candidatus Sulfotelmatobacter sp.]